MNLSSSEIAAVKGLLASPRISSNPVSGFTAMINATSKGVDIAFTIADATGVRGVNLLRNTSMDTGTATVLQTWDAIEQGYTWSDTDAALQSTPQAYYWLLLTAAGTNGSPSTIGPQSVLLNPQLEPSLPAATISASHGATQNGSVTVTANVSGIPTGGSVKVEVTGYHGSTSPVAVAQSATSPLQFTLDATGETVTLTAISVSPGGADSSTGPTTMIALSGAATVPAAPQGVQVVQIASGNQVSFPANRDAVTSYSLYRGQRGAGFVGATMLATIAPGTGTIEYLDAAGLTGDFEYYVIAVGPAGSSAPSPAGAPAVAYSSASLPPNVPVNTTNTATIDSIDTGTAPLARIYGPGGPGTSYSHFTGFGSLTRPNGSISGLAYSTNYYVLYDTAGKGYVATTSYTATLPDGYEYVGTFQTCAQTGGGGTGATATAVIDSGGHVLQLNATAQGSGYTPGDVTVTIAGGGGANAAATAQVNASGGISSYTVTNGGSGYNTAPAVTVTGTSSSGSSGGGGDSGRPSGGRVNIPQPEDV